MDREALLSQLVEFFRDSFSEDPGGVADWVAQGDANIDDFFATLDREFPKAK